VSSDDRWLVVERPDGHRLSVPLALVRRVETFASVTDVPLAPDGVLGIAEIGGRVLTLVDPRPFGPEAEEEPGRIVPVGLMPQAALLLAGRFSNIAVSLPAGSRIRASRDAVPGGTRVDGESLVRLVRTEASGWHGGAAR